MKVFSDLLDNYLLALGLHNQAHALHEHDPLKFTNEYHDAIEALQIAKSELNEFFTTDKSSNLIIP